jgi:hypothetical protein
MEKAVMEEVRQRGSGSASCPGMAGNGRAARYTRRDLAFYDPIVLGVVNPLVWRCPTAQLRRQYQEHVTSRHLDIGVGTGYFLDRVLWPDAQPSITLVDLNGTALAITVHRIARYRPHAVRRNAMEPLTGLPAAPFGSVGVGYLLHCIPGVLPDKASALFAAVSGVLAPGGVVFGSTILAAEPGTPRPARELLRYFNRHDVLHNQHDTRHSLEQALAAAFTRYRVEQVGSVALFDADTPRPQASWVG